MKKKLPLQTLRRAACSGPTAVGELPEPADCKGVLVEAFPLCTFDQWIELGRPLIAVRYALGRKGDIYGTSYCSTYMVPHKDIAIMCITPNNCVGVEVGIITDAGDHWRPASVSYVDDPAAAREYVFRKTGSDQPIYYWDHLLTMERAARYLDPDGRSVREPQFQVGQEMKSPAAVIGKAGDPDIDHPADDGSIVADGNGEKE